MTDWPDNLIDKLARLDAVCCRTCAEETLAALAEWCDGDLWDPTTGQRIERTEVARMGWEPYDDEEDVPCPTWRGPWYELADDVPLFTLSPRED